MEPDKKAISQVVASCVNENRAGDVAVELDRLFGPDMTASQKLSALAVTPVYTLAAEQPGYPVDGKPGILALGSDLKAAVLHELAAMIHADFDKQEHKATWQAIEKSVAATPEAEFVSGVAVNCPDDYLLMLDKRFASEVLREFNAMPDWH